MMDKETLKSRLRKESSSIQTSLVPLILYLLCLACPAFYFEDGNLSFPAFNILLLGWLAHPSWWANPLFIIAFLVHFRSKSGSLFLSIPATGLAFYALSVQEIYTPDPSEIVIMGLVFIFG